MWYLQPPFPIPTPTPSLAQATDKLNNTVQDTQALVNSVKDLSALGIIGLIVVLAILYVVFVLRARPGSKEDTSVKSMADALSAGWKLIERLEDDRKADRDRYEKQSLEDRLRVEKLFSDLHVKMIEGLSAVTDSMNRFADNDRNRTVEARKSYEERVQESKETHRLLADQNKLLEVVAVNVKQVVNEGSEPVQIIRNNTDQILQNSNIIISTMNDLSVRQVTSEQFNTFMTEVRLAISALRGVEEAAVKRKSDTHPIPQISAGPAT